MKIFLSFIVELQKSKQRILRPAPSFRMRGQKEKKNLSSQAAVYIHVAVSLIWYDIYPISVQL